jgi:hypothetical protein
MSKSLQKHQDRNYKYIHVGLVQVRIKPLTKEGLNTSILAVLKDARFQNFQDFLVLSSLAYAVVQFPFTVIQTVLFKTQINSYLKELVGLSSSKYLLKISTEPPLYFQFQVIDSKIKTCK